MYIIFVLTAVCFTIAPLVEPQQVGSLSTLETAHCVCKKLNVVSANLSVHSLLVDLTKKPKKIPFYQNAVMVSMVVFLWLTYIVALYWAYYADSADFAMVSHVCGRAILLQVLLR